MEESALVLAPETVREDILVREAVEVVRERVLCPEEIREVVDVLRTLPLSTFGATFSFRLPGKSIRFLELTYQSRQQYILDNLNTE